ncbi:MAG: YmdB family metallophosphoesterase [Victivallales bacterium]|nr:YmdB family metallophosphoesterase [Victivallales bacterium]
MNILFIGDIVGEGGRRAVKSLLPALREEFGCAFCIANGENMAGGNGFTSKTIRELDGCGVDVFTGGDHTWDQKGFDQEIASLSNLVRPANVSPAQPGIGFGIFAAANGLKVGVLNLLGRTFMALPSDDPFACADRAIAELRRETPVILVDFHAEATSDKIALGRHLDGRVSAVLGTHTHVPTADEQIFQGGTAFQCDVGMVGARDSILGRDIQAVIRRYTTGLPSRFTVVEKDIRLHATLVQVEETTGRSLSIQRIVRDCP